MNFSQHANLNNKKIDVAVQGWANNKNFSEVMAIILFSVKYIKQTTLLMANQIYIIKDIPNTALSKKEDNILISNE